MKIKYSTLKNFKVVTGKHFLEVEKASKDGDDYDKRFDALETMTLGLQLLADLDPLNAHKEFKRLIKPENEIERYDILDNADLDELLEHVAHQ